MLNLKGISKKFDDSQVLENFDLKVNEEDFLFIYGPSGCGKSTIINILSGQSGYESGTYHFEGKHIKSNKDRLMIRKKIGIVTQDFALLEHMSVLDNILLAIDSPKKSDRDKVIVILEYLSIEKHLKTKVSKLSGGEKQRVAIARALIKNPKVIIADEPTGSLDKENTIVIMDLLKKMNEDKITIILVTHDESIRKYAKNILDL